MKKLLTKVALASALISSAQAGAILDLEVGGGSWSTGAPTGTLETSGVEFDLQEQANLGSSDNTYMWLVIDHLIPVVPNIRIEQTTLKSTGTKTVNIAGLINGNVDTELDMSHTDIIAYWGVPFGTWLPFIDELDFGLGAKSFGGSLTMTDTLGIATPVEQSFDNVPVPYGYGKLRIEPPLFMGIGLEAELKVLSLDAVTFNETIVKADWGFTAPLPAIDIKAGLEVGYRTMSLNVDASSLKTDIAYDGIFFGLYGKFGI